MLIRPSIFGRRTFSKELPNSDRVGGRDGDRDRNSSFRIKGKKCSPVALGAVKELRFSVAH